MTTIAVCAAALTMAADSALNIGGDVAETCKLLRSKHWIIGAAGDSDQCSAFLRWASRNPDGVPRLKRSLDFEAVILTRDGRVYRFDHHGARDEVTDGIWAIGSGASYAIGSMERDLDAGRIPDAHAAIRVAAKRDGSTKLPVSFLTWRGA